MAEIPQQQMCTMIWKSLWKESEGMESISFVLGREVQFLETLGLQAFFHSGFLTLYLMALNSGMVDEDLALRAPSLHKSANQKSLESVYMFRELCPKCE